MPATNRAAVRSSAGKPDESASTTSSDSGLKGTIAPAVNNNASLPSTLPAPTSSLFKYVIVIPLVSLLITAATCIKSWDLLRQVGVVAIMSIGAYFATLRLIPLMQVFTLKRGMSGIDLNKPGNKEDKKPIPEALGVVSGVVYMIAIILVQLLYSFAITSRCELVEINAALHSICFMLFLGFADDTVDLPWRYKLILPTIATLPLLCAYGGGTDVIVPKVLRWLLPRVVELGWVYKLYMLLLAVFTSNAINIYAGINGLEAGQSFIIAIAIAVHNIIELTNPALPDTTHTAHTFSLFLILPFIGTVIALLYYNWYPSRVFVGDTFTTQAGMIFAVVGIMGHFSKTLLLFFIPQIINFLISLPQILRLFGLTCPRHRLPKLDPSSGKLVGQTINHNVVNGVLLLVGPMYEEQLCVLLLVVQAVCCAAGFVVRYYVAKFFY